MGLKPNPLDLSSFSALTMLVGSFDPQKPVPDIMCLVTWWDVKPSSINQSHTIARVSKLQKHSAFFCTLLTRVLSFFVLFASFGANKY